MDEKINLPSDIDGEILSLTGRQSIIASQYKTLVAALQSAQKEVAELKAKLEEKEDAKEED